jgi:hypothetical protein
LKIDSFLLLTYQRTLLKSTICWQFYIAINFIDKGHVGCLLKEAVVDSVGLESKGKGEYMLMSETD